MIPVLANQAKNTRDAVVLNAAGLIEIIVDGCFWLKATGRCWLLSTLRCPSWRAAIVQKVPVEGVPEIRADSVCSLDCTAGNCYLMEVWIVAIFIVFLNE